MAHTMEIPCFYCSGDGATEVDLGGGMTRTETCDECDGTGISCRRAGDRNTRALPPSYWTTTARSVTGDILVVMGQARRQMLTCKRTPDTAWRFPSAQNTYAKFRGIAMRPAGGVA